MKIKRLFIPLLLVSCAISIAMTPYLPHRRAHFRATSHWSANSAALDALDTYLKACYKFSGSALTTDSSGRGHTLTNVNTATENANGKSGYCVELDGSNQYVYAGDSDDWYFDGDFSISMWVCFDAVPTNFVQFVGQYVDLNNRWLFFFDPSGGISFYSSGGSGTIYFTQGGIAGWSSSTWYNIILTRIGNDINIYRNGTSVASATDADTMPNLSASLFIGYEPASNKYIDARIDEAMIFKGVGITSTQAGNSGIYNSDTGSYWAP